jgi:uncharacterized protein
MAKLTDLGFKKDVCCETIVSTYNPDGTSNAAPMGLKLLDEQHLSMSIFNTSLTCRNLKEKKCAIVNLTSDIEVFYKSTFKEANHNGNVPADWFVKADVVEAPKLRSADAVVEVSVTHLEHDGKERTRFSCKVERITTDAQFPQVYCRAMPLTLEAITHATRVKAFINLPEKQKEASELIETIQNHAYVVGRVAPNSEYTAVFEDLQCRIDSWRVKL